MTRRYSDVERLDQHRDIGAFDCGSAAQTDWLRNHAFLANAAGTSNVFVVRRLSDEKVVGFYALATGSIERLESPERIQKGTGRYDSIPVIILTRLGVDVDEQHKGLGKALVMDALERSMLVSEHVGFRCLLIHAETEEAMSFYLKLADFEKSPVDELPLFLLMKDLRRALHDAGRL